MTSGLASIGSGTRLGTVAPIKGGSTDGCCIGAGGCIVDGPGSGMGAGIGRGLGMGIKPCAPVDLSDNN